MITEGVFLCVGDVLIEVLYGIEMNDLLHCGTEGRYVNDRWDTELEIAGTGQRWLDLKVRMKPWLVERLLETLVSTCSVSNTGVLLQLADGKSEVSWLMDLRSMVKRPRVLGPRELMTTTRLTHVVKRSQMVFRCWRMRCALVRCTDSMLHHVRASHGWSLETLETCWTCLFSLLSLCLGSFRPTSRRCVGDHASNACSRDILMMRSGSRHLVDTCRWLIVVHRHARTSSHSAERLNLCLSGKEL